MNQLPEKINYKKIILNSGELIWRNKIILWIGFIASLGSGLQFEFSESKEMKIQFFFFSIPTTDLSTFFWIVLAILTFATILLSSLGISSLVHSTNKLISGKKTILTEELTLGAKAIWKVLAIRVSLFLSVFTFALLFFTPGLFLLFSGGNIFLSLLLFLLGAAIFTFSIVIIFFISQFGYFYAILSDLSVKDSLIKAYLSFKKNTALSIRMGLYFLGSVIIILMAGFLLITFLGIVGVGFGYIALKLWGNTGALIGVLFMQSILIFPLFLIKSIYVSFQHTVWLYFFRRITGIISNEESTEKLEKVVAESSPA